MGVSRKRLRSNDLWAPFTGVRVPVALGWNAKLRAQAGLLVCPPGTCVTGLHAVAAAGLPVPWGQDFNDPGGLAEQPLLVALDGPRQIQPWSRRGFAADPFIMPIQVERVLVDGVRRVADPDLWARTVASPDLRISPGRRRSYGATLAVEIARRGCGPDLTRDETDPLLDGRAWWCTAFAGAVLRLPLGVRHDVEPLLPVIRELLLDRASEEACGGM